MSAQSPKYLLIFYYNKMDVSKAISTPRFHYEGQDSLLLEKDMHSSFKQMFDRNKYDIREIENIIGGPAHIISVSNDGLTGATDFRLGGGKAEGF